MGDLKQSLACWKVSRREGTAGKKLKRKKCGNKEQIRLFPSINQLKKRNGEKRRRKYLMLKKTEGY
jgi:hypothetical protein